MTTLSYVLGFLFDAQLENVVLIRKAKPKWQAGLLNGVGGKVHTREADLAAMRREFLEETGSAIAEWHPFAKLQGRDWVVRCFYAVTSTLRVETNRVDVVEVGHLATRRDVIDNVPWLVFAARENWWSEFKPGEIELVYDTEEAA